MNTRRRLALICAGSGLIAASAVVGMRLDSEASTPDDVYLSAVRSDADLAGWSDADLVVLGHETCADLDATDGQFDAMFFAMSTGHPDRPELLDSADTVIVAAATFCPQWADQVEGIVLDMGY